MDVFEAICRRRSIRRFKQDPVPAETLDRLVEAARLAPSGANLQPCEFLVVDDTALIPRVFELLQWAGYIRPAGTPGAGEQPVSYLIVLINHERKEQGGRHDAAAAIENILLAAVGEGLGTCWIGSVDRTRLAALINMPGTYEIDSVIALGKPAEDPALEEMADNVRYWKDEDGRLHVPRRPLLDILHRNSF